MSELVSSAQLAEMALPILPKSKQGIEHVAKRDGWRIFSPPNKTSPNLRRRKSAACWPMCAPSSTARWPPTAWR